MKPTYEELQAQVEVLRDYIERGAPINFNPEKCERSKLLAATPAACLAQVKADAVDRFAKGCLSEISACTTYQHVINMLYKGVRGGFKNE